MGLTGLGPTIPGRGRPPTVLLLFKGLCPTGLQSVMSNTIRSTFEHRVKGRVHSIERRKLLFIVYKCVKITV